MTLPIGSWCGQSVRAKLSDTTVTAAGFCEVASARCNALPRKIGIRRVSKKSDETTSTDALCPVPFGWPGNLTSSVASGDSSSPQNGGFLA